MRKIAILSTFFLAFICTSCLNIVEEVFLNKDGSGSYSMTVDMDEMMSMMKSMMTEEQMQENDMFGAMDSAMQETLSKLRQIEGLSNVNHKAEGFKYTITYDFRDIEALNQGTANGSMSPGVDLNAASSNFVLDKNVFERVNPPIDDIMDDDEVSENLEMAKMLLSGATYKSVYHFPGKVKKVENEDANLSSDKKTVTLEVGLIDVLEAKALMGNKIKFKR